MRIIYVYLLTQTSLYNTVEILTNVCLNHAQTWNLLIRDFETERRTQFVYQLLCTEIRIILLWKVICR